MWLISIREAAELKGVSRHAIQYQIHLGHIGSKKFPADLYGKGIRHRLMVIVDDRFKNWQPRKDKRRNA